MGFITTTLSDDNHWEWTNSTGGSHYVEGSWHLPMAAYTNGSGIHMLEFFSDWNPVQTPVDFTGVVTNGTWNINIWWTAGTQHSTFLQEDFSTSRRFYRIEYWPAWYDTDASVSMSYVPGPSAALIFAAFVCLLRKRSQKGVS